MLYKFLDKRQKDTIFHLNLSKKKELLSFLATSPGIFGQTQELFYKIPRQLYNK